MGDIVLDPPEEQLAARDLHALIDRWLLSLKVAEITRVSYRVKIAHFVDWWAIQGPLRDWQLTQSGLFEFEVYLRSVVTERFNAPLSYSTRHSIMQALRMMFRWAATTNRTMKNYGEWVPWPDGATPQRKSATPDQLIRLMVAALDSRQPIRDQAILAFFIGTGCRQSEVASLNTDDLQILADGAGTAMVTGKRTKANPMGIRAVAFDAVTGRYLVRYMDALVVERGPLWINDEGEKLQAPGIYQMVKRTVKRAGLSEQIKGCHDLRRAFATILGLLYPDSPTWADMIRRQLGHKHYAMTAHYTLIEVDDIRDRIVTPLSLKTL